MIHKKTILILVAVIVLLIGAVFGIGLLQGDEDEPSGISATTVEIFKTAKETITEIELNLPEETFTFARKAEGEDKWYVKEKPDVRLKNTSVSSLVSEFSAIMGAELIAETDEDLAQYGLEPAVATFTVRFADGKSEILALGNQVPVKNSYYFCRLGEGKVYTIYQSKANTLLRSLTNYRDSSLLDVDTEQLNYVKIQSPRRTIELKLVTTGEGEAQSQEWRMLQPRSKKTDIQRVTEQLLTKIPAIGIKEYIDDTPADYGKYGLGASATVVSLADAEGTEQTLYFGGEDEKGNVYFRMGGRKEVCITAAGSVDWLEVDAFLLTDKFINLENIANAASITVEKGDQKHTLSIVREGETEVYKLNDVETIESTFKSELYQPVIGLLADGFCDDAVHGAPVFVITYHLVDGTTKRYEYVPYDERNYAVFSGGRCEYRILKKELDNMYASIENVAKGAKQ
ncbi:MAG: DUF4340 domain-containing protein [Ruminococcaceae bacterium]|nr:DUF4340 domain-containing protein [Oscillospiraceae bacterium]